MTTDRILEDARGALHADLTVRQSPGDSLHPMSVRAVQRLRDALHALTAAAAPSDDEIAVARNIVNQIGDLYAERIPSPDWVPVRQRTNDELDAFVARLIRTLRRTEEAQAASGGADGEQFVTDVDLERFEAKATPIYRSTVVAGKASRFQVADLGQWVIRLVAEVRRLRRSVVPEPNVLAGQIHELLDEMNAEGGRINYSDYCVLHGMVSQIVAGSEPQGEPSDAPKRLVHEVNMMLNSVASHGPHALTDTSDRMYTVGLLRRLRDAIYPKPAQHVAAGNAVRAEMARSGLDVHRMVYGREIANALASAALDASLAAVTEQGENQ
ncbi:hypothetical protein ACFY9N_11745 [Microbacterium sp. NPDC008134]|uniref:hypothetical protein n=1 Tax=Microbacterium sp. NPDC008134 TaxID=3364183 RepID=UPI0036EE471F